MPVIDHVEACILVDGIPLQEYPAVEADKPTEESNITYVEAIPGKRFTVSITWLPGFQLKRANTLVSKIDLDGLRRYCRRVNGDTLPRDRVLSREIVHNYSSGWIPGQEGLREVAYFTIGVLELTDSADLGSNTLTPEEISQLGEIKVSVFRGGKSKDSKARRAPQLVVHDQIPENMMKNRLLQNIIQLEGSQMQCHPSTRFKCKPLRGPNGKILEFTFRYRNKRILQQLGYLPRSPSPEPDYELISQRQEELIKRAKVKQNRADLEILELRTRIAQLEAASSGSGAAASTPRGRLKRKREGDGNEDVEEVTPPPQKVLSLVDLTGDD